MRALVPTGDPPELVVFGEVGEPAAGPDSAVVDVAAFGVNRGEVMRLHSPRAGWRPGRDIAGTVARAAADGSGPRVGSRVVGYPLDAGWAERVAVPTSLLVELPAKVSFLEAAALPLAGLSALRLLRTAGDVSSRRILLTGASGGVGHYLVELLAAVGADVTAVTATAQRGEGLLARGATRVIHDVDEAEGPFDIAFESVGGHSTKAALGKLGPRGRLIWFGGAPREPVTLNFFDFFRGPAGGSIEHFSNADTAVPDGRDLATLVSLVENGRLHPQLGLVSDWKDTAAVLRDLLERRVLGKAVLTVGDGV